MKRLLCAVAMLGCKSDKSPEPPPAAPVKVVAPVVDAAAPVPTDDTACAVAILVDDDGIGIATHAGSCRGPKLNGAHDFAWFETELKGIKTALAECSAAELASTNGSYQDVIHVMDVAVKVGFIDVGLSDPSGLSLQIAPDAKSHCALPAAVTARRPPSHTGATIPLHDPLQDQVTLPMSPSHSPLQQAPVIIVTKTDLMFQGATLVKVDAIARDASATIPALTKVLEAAAVKTRAAMTPETTKICDEAILGARPASGKICPTGLAILQADQATSAQVINTIVRTAKAAGYDNLLFAVKNR